MRAIVCHNTELQAVEQPNPVPGHGQVLLKVLRCGICGSDLHARRHANGWADLLAASGYQRFMRSHEEVVLGHEFSAEVLEYGPGCKKSHPIGSMVTAVPIHRNGAHIDLMGLSAHAPGAFAEYIVVNEPMLLPVPGGMSADVAALTEPLAVAWHAVQRSKIRRSEVGIVIGCGPIGLGTIAVLKQHGVAHVVACDPAAGRRDLALQMGANMVIDPREDSPYRDHFNRNYLPDVPALMELGVGMREKLGRLPLPWWHVWRLGEALGMGPKSPVIFDCVGAPGLMQTILKAAPVRSRIIVVGVCLALDSFEPNLAMNKEIDISYSPCYTPLDFHDTLRAMGNGSLHAEAMMTGHTGLNGVGQAFDTLAQPNTHAKILVNPQSHSAELTSVRPHSIQ